MNARVLGMFGFVALAVFGSSMSAKAQVMRIPAGTNPMLVPAPPQFVAIPPANRARRGRLGLGTPNRMSTRGTSPTDRTDAYGRPGLPRGQVYYGGRYFGSFNNRFYGPQYGYF